MKRFFQRASRRCVTRPTRARLAVESLEARAVPAVLIVNTADDNTNSDAVLTLREAISLVNSSGDATVALGRSLSTNESSQITGRFGTDDTIQFDVGALTWQTIALGSSLPQIGESMTIKGLGANKLSISGDHALRVFDIPNGVVVKLSGLTIEDGQSTNGAGILNYGTLYLTDSILANNVATGSFAQGGGIWNWGVASIANSTFSGNQANANIGSFSTAHGGAIFNGGTLTVTNSTLSDNQAIAASSSPQALGGAIFNGVGGAVTIAQSTLAGNTANGSGGPSFVRGGGLYNFSATANIANTIIAGNVADASPDVFSGVNSLGHNLIGNTDGSSGWVASDLLNLAPQLGPLSNNGGQTLTQALLSGSPAINAGSNALAVDAQNQPLAADQRGGAFVRVFGSAVDIGAFEVQMPKKTIEFVDSDGDKVRVKLAGPGEVQLGLTGGTGPVELIELSGTDPAKSALSITVTKPKGGTGDGQVSVGEIRGSGLKQITAPAANLTGVGINLTGPLGGLTVRDILNGADVIADGTSKLKTRIFAHVIDDDTTIDLDTAISVLRAARFNDGAILAPSIGTLYIRGHKSAGIRGDFLADVELSGAGVAVGRPALAFVNITGETLGSNFNVAGKVGSFKVGRFVDSRLFIGAGTELTAGLKIGSFRAVGIAGETTSAFVDSTIAADLIGAVTLKSVGTAKPDESFGVTYKTKIGSAKVTAPKFTFHALDATPQGLNLDGDAALEFLVKIE